MKKIGLALIVLTLMAQAELKRGSKNTTVIDTETKLEWQDYYNYDYSVHSSKVSSWSEAIKYCETLSFSSKSDWRLPNINELKTLIVDIKYAPTIDNIFENRVNGKYWSSTQVKNAYTSSFQYKWVVDFRNGNIASADGYQYSNKKLYVRCVRDYKENNQPDL